jgi:hypothetical protein
MGEHYENICNIFLKKTKKSYLEALGSLFGKITFHHYNILPSMTAVMYDTD